jgi:hypothetical protein
MNNYSRSAFVLGETFNEFFKLNSKDVLSSINDMIEKGNIFKLENNEEGCTFSINNIDYVAVKYDMGGDLRLMVSEVNLIKEKTLKYIKSVCFMDVELDFSHQILYYMDDIKSGKVNADINKIQKLYDDYLLHKKCFSDCGYDTQYIGSYIDYNTALIEKVLKSLNIESENIISVMDDEIALKESFIQNDLIDIFNEIQKKFNSKKPYHHDDEHFSLIGIPSDDDSILLGYNDVVSTDEYFMLLRKDGNKYSIIFETFNNLEKMEGYKKIYTLNAFKNKENTSIIKNLKPLYQNDRKNSITSLQFSTLAFSINDINRSLKNKN